MEQSGKYYTLEERQADKDHYYVRADLLGKCSIESIIALAVIEEEGVMSHERLAKILSVSRKTASKYLQELRDLDLLQTNISQEEAL